MPAPSSAVSELRTSSFRLAGVAALNLAGIPVMGLVIVWTIDYGTSKGVNPGPTFVEVGQWLADSIGKGALSDAAWVMPSLLAILIGVYASDYGARRQLSARGVTDGQTPDERRVLSFLTLVGALITTFVIDYFLLCLITVTATGAGAGHLVGIAAIGLLVALLGAAVGMLWVSPLTQLRTRNQRRLAQAVARRRRLGPGVHRARPLLVVTLWMVSPLIVCVAGFVAEGFERQRHGFAATFAVCFLLVGAVQVSWAMVTSLIRDALAGTDWGRFWLILCVAVTLGSTLVILWVGVVIGAERGWGWLVLLIAAGAVFAAAWWIPLEGRAATARWAWVPGAAHLELLRATTDRRIAQLRRERTRIDRYEAELAALERAREVSPRRRSSTRIAGLSFTSPDPNRSRDGG